jgi:RND family efflux transporter MFP subunit
MRKWVRAVAPLAVIALGVAGYAALHATRPPPQENEDPPRVHTVFVEPVQRRDVRLDVASQGEVRPRTAVELVAQVPGRIVAVSDEFTEGGRVEPGMALVTIEEVDHRLALGEARAAVADAELGLQQALAAADVARRQLGGQPDPTPLALHEPQIAGARARLLAARDHLARAEVDLERTRITLPFTGRMRDTSVDVGQYVSPGTPVGRAFATDVVEVRLPFTDAQLASLGLPIGHVADPGSARTVDLSAVVGGREHRWRGRLVRLDAAVDPATRLVYGLVEVRDPYGAGRSEGGMPLAVGLWVQAEVRGRAVADARVIPRAGLRAGDQVFVVDPQGLLRIRTVEVAHSDGDRAVIHAGLEPGERVVVSSIRNPIQGMRLNALAPGETTADAAADRAPEDADGGES